MTKDNTAVTKDNTLHTESMCVFPCFVPTSSAQRTRSDEEAGEGAREPYIYIYEVYISSTSIYRSMTFKVLYDSAVLFAHFLKCFSKSSLCVVNSYHQYIDLIWVWLIWSGDSRLHDRS